MDVPATPIVGAQTERKLRVLVVDDQPLNVIVCSQMLVGDGHVVLVAENGL
jgi:CheY-like chemotaxis protein